MIKLKEISYCGIHFGNSTWHSHINKCEICKVEFEKLKKKNDLLIKNWNKKCNCGCGAITKFGNKYIVGHSNLGKKQTDRHKRRRLDSWIRNGNSEKYSNKWKKNNPSSTEKNKKRLRDNNPAKLEGVKQKISKNNPMNNIDNINKIKQTKLDRYGNGGYNNHEKWKEEFLKNYGVDNPSKVKEFLEKSIDTRSTNLANGLIESKNNWKCGYYIRSNKQREWYDSSYELIKMKEYDDKNLVWTKKHGIKIPFIKNNGVKSFYVPDFLLIINNKKIIVEVKGWLKKDDVLKANSAINWCKDNEYEYCFLLGKTLLLNTELSFIQNSLKIFV